MPEENKKQKPWYKKWWVVLLFLPIYLVILSIFLLIWLSRLIWRQQWKKKYRVAAIVGLWVFALTATILYDNNHKQRMASEAAINTEQEGNCVGPDGKRLWLSEEKCRAFNDAWKNPQQSQQTQEAQAAQPPTNTPVPTSTPLPVKKTYPTAVYTPPTATPTTAAPPAQNDMNNIDTGSSGGYSGSSGGDKDCADFATHAEAQAFFESAGAGDPHRLDRDGDGSACETLP